MCFGGNPKPPKVEYQGPSKDQIAQQEASLKQYEQQMAQQQAQFTTRCSSRSTQPTLRPKNCKRHLLKSKRTGNRSWRMPTLMRPVQVC